MYNCILLHACNHTYIVAYNTYTHKCIYTIGIDVALVHSHQPQGVDDIVDDATVLIIPYYCTTSMMVYLLLLVLILLLHLHSVLPYVLLPIIQKLIPKWVDVCNHTSKYTKIVELICWFAETPNSDINAPLFQRTSAPYASTPPN